MTIKELCEQAHAQSRKSGWYDDGERNIPEMLALIHSEVSEALEDYRAGAMEMSTLPSGKPVGFESELADTVIRVCDLAGYLGIDLERAIAEKMAYNATRGHRHGGKRC